MADFNLNKINFSLKRKYSECSDEDDERVTGLNETQEEVLTRAFPNGYLSSLDCREKSKLYWLMKWLSNRVEVDSYGRILSVS